MSVGVRILLLEDDKLFNETVQDVLEEEGFVVDAALDPHTALDKTYKRRYDLYLFDVNLPYESGFDLLGKLRHSGDSTPTIFLTSREDKASMIEGFNTGADDYMTKPIDIDELLLRIRAVLRRQLRSDEIVIGAYRLDRNAKRLYKNDEEISDVKQKAIELLMLLLESKGNVVTHETIKERLWSAHKQPQEGVVRVYVTQLKKHFPGRIVNIRGVGYKWIDA
jgi:DNA-binding response OmpR family regulator